MIHGVCYGAFRLRATDAAGASAGESAARMLRSRLQGWIYADPDEVSGVAGADDTREIGPGH